jgi:CP family cyanate transporter-like MFS transporter
VRRAATGDGHRPLPLTGSPTGALLVTIVLVALNLRGVLSATAPVLPEVTSDLGLSEARAGLLTTVPVLCFALFAPPAAALVRRFGVRRSVVLALAGVALATALRPVGGAALLLAGTLLVGICLTVGNVAVPVMIKRAVPARVGLATGLFTAGMCLGAALTAGLTEPLAGRVGWRAALGGWALLAVIGAVAWQVVTREQPAAGEPVPAGALSPQVRGRSVWGQPRAWTLAAFLAVQSCAYFSLTAWLPLLLADRAGVSLHTGGVAMSAFQLLGIAGTLLVPVLVGRFRDQVPVATGAAALWGVTVAGLLLAPSLWPLWTFIGGLSHGAGISTAFTMVALRAADAGVAASLSGMVQFVGYGVGATAPVVVGALYGATGSWTLPLSLLLVGIVGMAAAGSVGGRDVPVTAPAGP